MAEMIGPLRLLFDGTGRHASQVSVRYSRFVGIMKLVLPISAAILIGLVIAWPDSDPQRSRLGLTFADIDVGNDGEVGMTRVRYVGVDKQNQPFVVTAGRVLPKSKDAQHLSLQGLQADMTIEGGRWVTLIAEKGLYDRERETLQLDGKVDIYSDDGLELHTQSAFVDFATGLARGQSPVQGQGPFGLFRAEAFKLFDNGQRVVFSGGVKLTLRPAKHG